MFGRKQRSAWERNAPLTADQYEREAEIAFREGRRTGSAVFDAHGRVFKLHAERVRRGLSSIERLPADVLREWDWAGSTATLRARGN